jgi:penicillin amidase
LDLDRITRRKGLAFGAELGLKHLQENDPQTYALAEAYADGVNQYIDQLDAAQLPVEYKILNYRPEHWSVFKSLLLLKYMSDMLVGDRDLEYSNLRKILGQEMLDKLFPAYPSQLDPVIESGKLWEFEALAVSKPDSILYPSDPLVIDPLPHPAEGAGSNNSAVSGSKTKNGKPILANDPHLGLNLPSLWYSMQLTTPEHSAKGATLPGALGIISGFNENIAWGVTNATKDARDWYKITFQDDTRKAYIEKTIYSDWAISRFPYIGSGRCGHYTTGRKLSVHLKRKKQVHILYARTHQNTNVLKQYTAIMHKHTETKTTTHPKK